MSDTSTGVSPITFINVFEMPESDVDSFISLWEARYGGLAGAAGFISAELHRSINADARFALVATSRWDSGEHFTAATAHLVPTTQPAARAALTSHMGLYRSVSSIDAGAHA